MEKDRYGYAGDGWHPVLAELNDAKVAHQLTGDCSSSQTIERIEQAEAEAKKLRRQIEDIIRKSDRVLNVVAVALLNSGDLK